MWDAFATYLLGTGGAAPLTLPSAPYAAAQELQRRQLPFFQGLTLGEMEHVVRLAIGKRRLLCHLGDSLRAGRALKPGSLKSAEVSKKDATKSKVDGSTRGDIRDLEDLTVVLLYVMQRFPEGAPLSLLKQHIQTHAHRTLSEADFKCSKLADIFKMAPLRNIFPLEHVAHRNEIVVVPPRMEWIPPRLLPRLQQLQQQLQPFGDAVAAHAGMGAELGPAGMPYAMQWGAMGGVPMQTQPGFVLGASTSMPPGWVMTPQVGVSTEDGAAGYAAGAWPRPW
ncbi:unnamed protein product [Prorocentrum cordatum]|uniref:HTH OST-type domain-containing protein n=1 Tax=Prorocentrum cordatum TaxID=2364126 RepID=A0ABN9S2R7_9DINO|nr:unnamed protein product [Polarella glacialis]